MANESEKDTTALSFEQRKELIERGESCLGIEFGSTRIKAVVIDAKGTVLASGGHSWENRLEDGIWTYSMEDITTGLQDCYADLLKDIRETYGVTVKSFASMGFSAMMHGYLAFNDKDELLVPFRTWRNTITEDASTILTREFNYNIPQRWSISHLFHAIINKEEHVKDIAFFTTLAGYVHWKLTGEKVLGVGDASGMFPIDPATGTYDGQMVAKFDELSAKEGFSQKLLDIIPRVLSAGEDAGKLTEEGAKFLDVSGNLCAGIPICPPEGDAGTGMAATNSVAVRTGNISAGTSIFAMVVLEKNLSKVYPQIDIVTTPDGAPVGMVHCNNCTSDINAWVNVFKEFAELYGMKPDMGDLFTKLYSVALEGDADCGGLLAYNFFSGEPVAGFENGVPVFARTATDSFSLANVMRMNLYSALASLKIGLDLMLKEEKVEIDEMFGHGGYFKTKKVGQAFAAAAINAPVSVMETAGEGGAWGIALLASYMVNRGQNQSLQQFLNEVVFADMKSEKLNPDPKDVAGFEAFMERYRKGLTIEKAAVEALL